MKLILAFLFSFGYFSISAQVTIVSKNNFNFTKGTYLPSSTNTDKISGTIRTIQPQTETSSNAENLAFLFPPKTGILLFKSQNLNDPENIAGKLSANSIVRIDTAFHNQAYRTEDNSTFSFDIVYALTINGQKFYTDFRPHDFIPFQYPLTDQNQLFILAGRSTGYDMYADKGYPNHFHVAVLSKIGGLMGLTYASEELPFDYENEFWEANRVKPAYDSGKKQLSVEIMGRPNYKAIWNGSELKKSDL